MGGSKKGLFFFLCRTHLFMVRPEQELWQVGNNTCALVKLFEHAILFLVFLDKFVPC